MIYQRVGRPKSQAWAEGRALGMCLALALVWSTSGSGSGPGPEGILASVQVQPVQQGDVQQPWGSGSASGCRQPAPAVDWSQFNAVTSPFDGAAPGRAAVYAQDLTDPGLPWLMRGLQSMRFSVVLLVGAPVMEAARTFLASHNAAAANTTTVTLEEVSAHDDDGRMAQVFVHVCAAAAGTPAIMAGRGHVNLLLMAPGQHLERPAPHLNSTWAHDMVLASYDYLLSRSTEDSNNHMAATAPALRRLQQRNVLFPLADTLGPWPSAGDTGDTRAQAQVLPSGTAGPDPLIPSKELYAKMRQVVHRAHLSKVVRFFMQHTLAAYKACLTPAVQQARAASHTPSASPSSSSPSPPPLGSRDASQQYAAVIVEARPHYAFLYSVLNAVWYLPGWRLHVVHTRLNAGFVRRVLAPHVTATYHLLDPEADNNLDIDGYNRLLKTSSFWQMFGAEVVLLFQTDSLILRPGLEAFAHFDYIGAPWHQGNERWSQPAVRAALPGGVGNGGFSIRSVRAMVEVCDQHGRASPVKEQEDVFFAVQIQNSSKFVVADRQSAFLFCLEVPCRDITPAKQEPRPHAIHKAWYFNNVPTTQRLLDTSLLGLHM